jgi:hypothetical protein
MGMSLPPAQSKNGLILFRFSVCHVQAFILSHELTPEEEMSTCLARQLSPLRPMISFGRAAKADPVCKPEECVWYWWKDVQWKQPHTHLAVLPVSLPPGPTLSLLSVTPCSIGEYGTTTM